MNVSRISLAASLTLAFAALACSGGTPQPPPAGTLKIVAKGGAGTTGLGGSGGQVAIFGVGGGPLQVLQTGSLDPSFAVSTTQPVLGPNPKAIATNTTLIVGDPANPVNGDTVTTQVATGLWVKPGITLTLQPFAGTTSSLTLSNGVFVEGTLTATRDGGGNSRNIMLNVANLVVTTPGKIDLSGADGLAGGFGGAFRVDSTGAISCAGTFTAKGGNGTAGAGGGGGTFRATSSQSTFSSSGAIDVSGGTGTGGPGGTAGYIRTNFATNVFGDVGSSGALTAKGGDGTAGGGNGGTVMLRSARGAVRSSSAIDTSGGNATTAGDGGSAGPVTLQTQGTDVLVTGTIRAQGGAGVGAGGSGGQGNAVLLTRENAAFPGSIRIAAGIDTSGGAGPLDGGSGGDVSVTALFNAVFPEEGKQEVSLLGYSSIDTSGAGGGSGGSAGNVTIGQSAGWSQPGGTTLLSDDVRNEVPITARGAAGTAGGGGAGGTVSITGYGGTALPVTRSTVNVADVDASGGTGTTAGGPGGSFGIGDMYKASNVGKVSVAGGGGGTGNGGAAGRLDFVTNDGPVENLGELTAGGGSSTSAAGGRGGTFFARATAVTAAQKFTGDGGVSTSNRGGNGGLVQLTSFGTATVFSGTASVKVGTGATGATPAPIEGTVSIDGVAQALTGGQYTK